MKTTMKTKKIVQWVKKPKTPHRKGWYITRNSGGILEWRCWGAQQWWKQLKDGGWLSWYDAYGCPMDFDYMPHTRMSIDLDRDKLPSLSFAFTPTRKQGSA